MRLTVRRATRLQGSIRPPSDKSLTHRAYMLAACATSPSVIAHPLTGEDCEATLQALVHMGLTVSRQAPDHVELFPSVAWQEPDRPLDCGNSGTTMRLLAGLIASRPICATLIGDASLSRRPMQRIVDPLVRMGAKVEGRHPPLQIQGGELKGIDYVSPHASAQVKSCVLLAGLRASGETWVTEPRATRDHTERMLQALGVRVVSEGNRVGVQGGSTWSGFRMSVPGDISSSAFWLVAGALVAGSEVELSNVGLNWSRTGILDVMQAAGVAVEVVPGGDELGEPCGRLIVRPASKLLPFTIEGDLVPRLIDEIPVLCVLATQCEGVSYIRDAAELRVKESDRIERMAGGLRAMGARVEVEPDGLTIGGPTPLQGIEVDAEGDHRIAMSFAVAGLIANGETRIANAESVRTSYPEFERHLLVLTDE